ncbi:hypothetical protein [Oceanicoccus sp. KOV_DT_Chl]|uniref:hypothetical protein n=1 Tax=Oceanicoccus sp. KOV_DT_Chl TaxID=1904639 RepID=UPI000C7CA199|nr:hypothetical protein [Oceanicoccus sp. KOV_DT_Chl]
MDYISIAEAIPLPGLRLVLTAGAPNPWGESAKAILQLKNIDFTAVAQEAAGENADLQQWTGQTSAPVAVFNDETARTQSVDIIFLAERINPEPALIPAEPVVRSQMFGLIREIIGEQGFAWNRRLLMLHPMMQHPEGKQFVSRLAEKYGYSAANAEQAAQKCVDILALLSEQLLSQQRQGSRYFLGDSLTALDVYWANFAAMLKPLPPEQSAMDAGMRHAYETLDPVIAENYDPILLQHRDFIYQQHLTLPLDF